MADAKSFTKVEAEARVQAKQPIGSEDVFHRINGRRSFHYPQAFACGNRVFQLPANLPSEVGFSDIAKAGLD